MFIDTRNSKFMFMEITNPMFLVGNNNKAKITSKKGSFSKYGSITYPCSENPYIDTLSVVEIEDTTKIIFSKKVEVYPIPVPTAVLSKAIPNTINSDKLKQCRAIRPDFLEMNMFLGTDYVIHIDSFELILLLDNKVFVTKNIGYEFSTEQLNLISQLSEGDKIIIDNVYGKNYCGKTLILKSSIYKVVK